MGNTQDSAESGQKNRIKEVGKQIVGDRGQIAVKLVFALLYTLFLLLGDPDHWRALFEKPIYELVFLVAGIWLVAFLVLSILFTLLDLRKETDTQQKGVFSWKVFAIFLAVCLLCWMPYYLLNFPGWVSNDSVWQLEQICGMKPYSNHHPFFHTMLIRIFFETGRGIFGTVSAGVATFVFAQMVFMAGVYALILADLYRRNVKKGFIILGLIFYALLPVNGIYAIGMGKDTVFAGVLLLFVREVCLFVEEDRCGKGLVITGLLVCLLRSNGILIFAGTAVGMVIYSLLRKKSRKMLICTGIVLGSYLVYQSLLLGALHVTQPDTVEGLTMPIQHMLSAYMNDGKLTAQQTEFLQEIVPLEGLEEYYNPSFFDLVKNHIREEGNQEYIADHKMQFFRMWLEIGLKNPVQYLEAEVRQTYGYWGLRVETPLYEQYRMAENPFDLTVQRKVFSYDFGLWADTFLQDFQTFFNRIWSLGLTTWLMLGCMAYAMYGRRNILPYLPLVMLFVSLLLATPVYAEFRYTYGIFVAIPLLLAVTLKKTARKEA